MKKIQYWSKYISLCGLMLLSILSCSDVDNLSPQELRTEEILGTWIIESVMIDGLDATANYPNFKIDFQENGIYSSINGGRIFRPTGTWNWINKTTTTLLQLDVFTDVTIASYTVESTPPVVDIKMSWQFNYVIGGIRAGTNGNYLVTFKKL